MSEYQRSETAGPKLITPCWRVLFEGANASRRIRHESVNEWPSTRGRRRNGEPFEQQREREREYKREKWSRRLFHCSPPEQTFRSLETFRMNVFAAACLFYYSLRPTLRRSILRRLGVSLAREGSTTRARTTIRFVTKFSRARREIEKLRNDGWAVYVGKYVGKGEERLRVRRENKHPSQRRKKSPSGAAKFVFQASSRRR